MAKEVNTKLTAARLREVLTFDADTGAFYWAVSCGKACVGKRAGKLRESGRVIGIDGENYGAARLAWLWVHGEWPERILRFQDGNRDNTTIANLAYGKNYFVTQEGKNEYARKWRASNPRIQRHLTLKTKFGISLEQYQKMFVDQGGVCAICKCPETTKYKGVNGDVSWLSVDHDHSDHTVRGLLCSRCNHMLGHAKDKVETLRAGAAYLEAHAAKPKTNVIPLAGRKATMRGKKT